MSKGLRPQRKDYWAGHDSENDTERYIYGLNQFIDRLESELKAVEQIKSAYEDIIRYKEAEVKSFQLKLKAVEKIANGSYSTFGKGDYELGYEAGIEFTLELIKEATI